MISTIGKKLVNLQGLSYISSNLGELWSTNEFLLSPKVSHSETLPVMPHGRYNGQSEDFGTCYVVARAYSLEQQNAGRAQAWLRQSPCIYS